MNENKKVFIRKPTCRSGVWGFSVCESKSPLAEEIEFVECGSREAAFNGYRNAKKQEGSWL